METVGGYPVVGFAGCFRSLNWSFPPVFRLVFLPTFRPGFAFTELFTVNLVEFGQTIPLPSLPQMSDSFAYEGREWAELSTGDPVVHRSIMVGCCRSPFTEPLSP
ncbi:MAG TPA: hypothetical protein VHW44_07040 [Pseudonocardiaceae bacterium]|nr:hypothetical protein [Pseudonocardiaceae bacterium]